MIMMIMMIRMANCNVTTRYDNNIDKMMMRMIVVIKLTLISHTDNETSKYYTANGSDNESNDDNSKYYCSVKII